MKSFDCTVIGDVFFDVIAQKKLGQQKFFKGGISFLDYAKISPGGCGNIAVGMSILGLKTAFIGKAGKDSFGNLYKKDLLAQSVLAKLFFDEKLPTGLVISLTESGGERSFEVFRGANDTLTSEDIESTREIIERSKYLYVCGYSLVSSNQQNAVLKAVDIAKKHNTMIIFDPGAYNLIKIRRNLFMDLLSKCDVFCPNLREAKTIANTAKLATAIESLRENVPFATIKLGEKGSIIINGKTAVRTPGLKVAVEDTTGAGDAFTAAIIYGLIKNLPLNLTAKFANWYAAQIVTSYGARSYPSKVMIRSFLEDLK